MEGLDQPASQSSGLRALRTVMGSDHDCRLASLFPLWRGHDSTHRRRRRRRFRVLRSSRGWCIIEGLRRDHVAIMAPLWPGQVPAMLDEPEQACRGHCRVRPTCVGKTRMMGLLDDTAIRDPSRAPCRRPSRSEPRGSDDEGSPRPGLS